MSTLQPLLGRSSLIRISPVWTRLFSFTHLSRVPEECPKVDVHTSHSSPNEVRVPRLTTTRLESMADISQRSTHLRDRINELKTGHSLQYPILSKRSRDPTDITDFISQNQDALSKASGDDASTTYLLYGRVVSIRWSGSKLAFIDIEDRWARTQVVVNYKKCFQNLNFSKDSLNKFKEFARIIRRGDLIAATGIANFGGRQATLRLQAHSLPQILSPAIAPLPETILDDRRMTFRHVDLLTNKKSSETLVLRSTVTSAMRTFFQDRDFVEVSTPIIAPDASGAIATPFKTTVWGEPESQYSLRIAPELWLKRLVVSGFSRVFEIGPAFRNEGQDALHNPEFTICEFYKTHATIGDLMQMTESLMYLISKSVEDKKFSMMAPSEVIRAFGLCSTETSKYPHVKFLPMLEACLDLKFCDLMLHKQGGKERFIDILLKRNILDTKFLSAKPSISKILDALAKKYIETMYPGMPFFITHHPAAMSPLSKWTRCHETGCLVAQRAELFYNGMELANMYEEENDPFEQRRKFYARLGGAEDFMAWQPEELDIGGVSENKNGCGHVAVPSSKSTPSTLDAGCSENIKEDDGSSSYIDEQYIETLLQGMPPTGGWGCGIDRLVMVLSGQTRISDVLPFGSLRHVKGLAARSRQLAVSVGSQSTRGELSKKQPHHGEVLGKGVN